jgi:nitrogen fixation protein
MYPDVEAVGYLVKDGKVSKYLPKKAIAESIISIAKSTRVRNLYES